jgi:hypothetical protein
MPDTDKIENKEKTSKILIPVKNNTPQVNIVLYSPAHRLRKR